MVHQPLQLVFCRRFRIGRIDAAAQIGIALNLQRGEMEQHLARFRMPEFNHYFRGRAHLALSPQPVEIGMDFPHFLQKLFVPFILHILTVVSAEYGQKASHKMHPIDGQSPEFFPGE